MHAGIVKYSMMEWCDVAYAQITVTTLKLIFVHAQNLFLALIPQQIFNSYSY